MAQEIQPAPREGPPTDEPPLQQTVALVASALRRAHVPYAFMGGCAVHARGGPQTTHDIDLLLCEDDVDAAVTALVEAGMTEAVPPEDWLRKVWHGPWLVDLIFRPHDRPCTPADVAEAERMPVGSVVAPVLPATVLVIDKLLVLSEHRCDFTEILPMARALREQVDWDGVRTETIDSPYARAFLVLAEDLGVAPMKGESWQTIPAATTLPR